MTLVFNKKAWHYKLILYVWSEKFFLDTSELDWKAMENMKGDDIMELGWQNVPRISKPKTVNLCPYCRAVVASVVLLPFHAIWRLFPHKKREETRAAMMKRSDRNFTIVRGVVAGAFGAFGVYKIIEGDYWFGAFYMVLVAFNVRSPEIFKWVATKLNPAMERLAKWNFKRWKKNQGKPKRMKVTPEFFKKLSEKHDAICPPIFFVDVKDAKELI